MCGICGFVGRGDETDLEGMLQALKHRGPDGRGVYSEPDYGLFLGHTRLAVIDIEGGSQPMAGAGGSLVLVYNGEIYNHRRLRKGLEENGALFRTSHCDSEVLVHGYEKWGRELPGMLNGMWAFALFDKKNRKIFLSRDRFGQKPLYYIAENNFFAFASEITALFSHRFVSASYSMPGLKKYFAYGYVPGPATVYKGIKKLQPGENLIFDLETFEIKKEKYWEFLLEPFENPGKKDIPLWEEEIARLLSESVKRRLMADVPLACF